MSYGIFSSYYDLFTQNVDYKAYADRIDGIIKSLGLKQGSLVDLGCGTASLDVELCKLGYDITAIDLSCDMLTAAAQKVYSQNLNIRLVNQDMTSFALPFKAEAFISTLDGLNHLDGIESVKKVFAGVKKYLKPKGVFIFDMNTEYKHRYVLADNSFIFDSDEAYLGWQNEYHPEDSSVDITLDFFLPDEDGYQRITEEFRERAYPVDTVLSALKECGLKAVAMYAGTDDKEPSDTTQRILFVARHI